MHKSYMSDYWRGRGINKTRVEELLAELADLTGGKVYSTRTLDSYGKRTVRLVCEYDDSVIETPNEVVTHN